MLNSVEGKMAETFFRSFSVLAFLVLVGFGSNNYIGGNLLLGFVELGFSVLVLINLVMQRLYNWTRFAVEVLLTLVTLALIFMFVTGGMGGTTGVYWYFVFPIACFFLLERMEAIAYILILATLSLLAYYLGNLGLVRVAFNFLELRQLMISYFVVAFLVDFYKRNISSYQAELEEKRRDLDRSIREKDEEVLNAMQSYAELKRNKLAMLNLLEDARELEKKLKEQKQGIEEEVNQKTHELRIESAQLLAVINSISRGLFVVDRHMAIIVNNMQITDILEINNINFEEIELSLKNLVEIRKIVTGCFTTGKEYKHEVVQKGKKSLLVHVVPVLESRLVLSVAVFVQDVTEEEALVRSRDEFFSIASHELRTPLTSIRGNSSMIMEMYLDKIKDKDFAEMVSDIHEGSVRLIGIVNEFLDMGRLEQGRIEFKIEDFEVKELLNGAIEEMSGVTMAKPKIAIQVEVPSCLVSADKDRIRQVFTNLIGNSYKFTESGFVKIKGVVDGKYFKIQFSDSGAGIAEKNQGLLFRKFQQASNNIYTRDTSKGTGLGLYVSRLMMDGMRGSIDLLKSSEGEGSTFEVKIPLSAVENNSKIDHI